MFGIKNYNTFYKQQVLRPITRLKNPKLHNVTEVFLPQATVIHYIPESETENGPSRSHVLFRNIGDRVLTYHVTTPVVTVGSPKTVPFNPGKTIREYHKFHRTMFKQKSLTKALNNLQSPLVVNYALADRGLRYLSNNRAVLYQWTNIRNTLWDTITKIGYGHKHFIRFKLPDTLPTKQDFNKYLDDLNVSGLEVFNSIEALDILELWKGISDKADSHLKQMDPELTAMVHLVFTEGSQVVIIRLSDILEYAVENEMVVKTGLYSLLEQFIDLRVTDTDEERSEFKTTTDDVVVLNALDNDSAIIDKVNEASKIGTLSAKEQSAIIRLAAKTKDIKNPFGEGTLSDLQLTEDDYKVPKQTMPDIPGVVDKGMLVSSISVADAHYIDKLSKKHLTAVILSLQMAGIVVKDIKVTNRRTAVTNDTLVSVSVQVVGGAASTIKLRLPTLASDGTMLVTGTKNRPIRQRSELPLVKLDAARVAITTYYGKVFVVRNKRNVNSLNVWLKRNVARLAGVEQNPTVSNVKYGTRLIKGVLLPRYYTGIASGMRSFRINDYDTYWDYNEIKVHFTEDEIKAADRDSVTLFGRSKQDILGIDFDNNVKVYQGDKSADVGHILTVLGINDLPPIEFSEFTVFNKAVPLGISLVYRYGMDRLLKLLDVSYTTANPQDRAKVEPGHVMIRFKDISYMVDISNPKVALIIGGIHNFRKELKAIKSTDMRRKHTYSSLLYDRGITSYHLAEIDLMWDMLVDPITADVLKAMHEPTKVQPLLLRANELLVDEYIPEVVPFRVKSHERMNGMVYTHMVKAIREQRQSRGTAPLSFNTSAMWLDILQDSTTTIVEDLNPIHNLKEREAITFGGVGGRNTISMVKDTRGFNKGDIGTISEATSDSSKVGIRTFLTANPLLDDLTGVPRPFDKDTDGPTSLLSTSALLAPAITHDD